MRAFTKIEMAERALQEAREKFVKRCDSWLFAMAVARTYSKLLQDRSSQDRESFLLNVSFRAEGETPSRFARWYYSLDEYVGTQFFNEHVFDDYLESILALAALKELDKIDGRSRLGRRVASRFA